MFKPRKEEPLDIRRMDHNFIRLVVFVPSNNVNIWLRMEPFGMARLDFMRWDADELP